MERLASIIGWTVMAVGGLGMAGLGCIWVWWTVFVRLKGIAEILLACSERAERKAAAESRARRLRNTQQQAGKDGGA